MSKPITLAQLKRLQDGTQSEAEIEKTCSDFLALDGWVALTTDPKQLRGLGVSEKGIPDKQYRRQIFDRCCSDCPGTGKHAGPRACLMCRASVDLMWCEWKRVNKNGKATKTSERQNDWHAAERSRGFLTLRAGVDFPATIEGFQKWYRASGLMRRKI